MAKRTYDDDDGRTIVDMSAVERPRMFGTMFRPLPSNEGKREPEAKKDVPESDITKKERRSYIFGALGAALMIGAVFAIVFAIAIIIMLTVWRAW